MSPGKKDDRNKSGDNDKSREAKEITCTGVVVDNHGKPVSGAKVIFYQLIVSPVNHNYGIKAIQNLTTKKDGAFIFKTEAESDIFSSMAFILVEKKGLAIGWTNWSLQKNHEKDIILSKPKNLSGKVVDDDHKPIVDAEVSITILVIPEVKRRRSLRGHTSIKSLRVKTDTKGNFSFKNIPSDAMVEFLVRKQGMATVSTFNPRVSKGCGFMPQFSPGQTDIKIVQPHEAKIQGVVVEKTSGKPVAGINITIRYSKQPDFGLKPVVSGKDGKFVFNNLAPDEYILQVATPREGMADWVAEPVELVTEAGKATSGVKIELCKGGLLEVLVTEDESQKPVEKAEIFIQDIQTEQHYVSLSDKNGTARIRLMPEEYKIFRIYRKGFANNQQQENVIIKDGKTEHIKLKLRQQVKISGTVRDNKGKTLKGAKLTVCPRDGQETISDSEGKFEIVYDPVLWIFNTNTFRFLLCRYEKDNLAAAVEIEENTKTIDVDLKPGVLFTGKVADPEGNGIADALILLIFRNSEWKSPIGDDMVRTDIKGNFEIKAIPYGYSYELDIQAEGYGKKHSEVIDTNYAMDNHIDIGTITLAVANLSVSGVVVNENDKPMGDVDVECHGENQPYCHTQTDADGKFTFEKICAGKIKISARIRGKRQFYGNIETEGGAADVKIVLSEYPTCSFTSRARNVMAIANQEAHRLKNSCIETEHILLALIKEGGGVGVNAMMSLGVDLISLQSKIEKQIKPGPDIEIIGKHPQTPLTKNVIEDAIDQAVSLNHNYVGTEHILLGLLKESEGMAAKILESVGLNYENVHKMVLKMIRR